MPLILALLSKISSKDWLYGGLIAALLIAFAWYSHHERVIGAQQEVTVVAAAEKKQQAAVDAIIANNQKIEDQANETIKALSSTLATANADLGQRLHNDTSANRSIIVPEASCPSVEPANGTAAKEGTSSPSATAQRSSIETQVLKDDLNIALDHNEQLQAIIEEFQAIRK